MRRVAAVVVLALAGCGGTAKDPCAGVDCGAGVCAVAAGSVACLCPSGFQADGLSCRPLPVADLCASNPCAALSQSLCLVRNGSVSCECPSTRVEVAGACVVRTPCTPNPCTRAHRTTCVVEGGAASCVCDPGYVVEGDGCSATPLWDCGARHFDGDGAEADECPTLAKALAFDTDEARTLYPAGDHDWLRLGVTRGLVFTFSATSTSLPLLAEVFDATGTRLLASDNRGATMAEVSFVAPAETVLVRVRAVRGNVTGDYTARYREVGADDYVNEPAGALTVQPAAPFVGELQYEGDLDVVWLELPQLTAVQLAVPDAGNSRVVFSLSRPDGGTRLLSPGDSTSVTVPTTESMLLTARGATSRDVGPFSLQFSVLGADDYSDDPTFALPVPLGSPVSGVLQTSADLDSVRVDQVRDRLYAWQPLTTATGQLALMVFDPRGQALVSSSWSSSGGVVWKASDSTFAALRLGSLWGTASQPWSFRVEDLGFDDHSDTLNAATPLTAGTPQGGRLELLADVDTFSFTAQAGHVMQASSSASGTALQVTMFDAQNQQLAQGSGSVAAVAATTGTYRVQVQRNSSSGGLLPYTVTVTDLGVDDFGATPGVLTLGAVVNGSVQWPQDVDPFDFVPVVNHVYELTATRVAGGTFSVRVKDPAGAVVASSYSGSSRTTSFLASVAGAWRIEISGDSSQIGSYQLSIVDRGLEDHGGTQATATAVMLGAVTSGVLGFENDLDVFSFPVTQGKIYQVTASSSSVRVELRDSQYTYISAASSVRAASTGTMYAVVSSWSATVPASYTLTVTDLGTDDHGDTAATATVATLGSAVTGSIQFSGDVDVLALTPTAGHHLRVVCTTAVSSCSLVVRDAAATVIVSGSTSVSFKVPAGGGTFFLTVSSYSSTLPLAWSVTASDLGPDDHGDVANEATSLAFDAGVSGVLEVATDIDAFRVSPAFGEIVQVTVQGTNFSPQVQVQTPSGTTATQTYGVGTTVTVGFLNNVVNGVWTTRVSTSSLTSTSVSYTVSARTVVDDYPTPTAISVGQLTSGVIDYGGDVDALLVPMTAGASRSLTLSGTVRATVTDGSGAYVTTLYSGSSRTLTAATTGTYRVDISFDYGSSPVAPWTFIAQ
ncbi:MAG: calcium-binding EGF-like domain-containing protein [Myxococcota bacterium]